MTDTVSTPTEGQPAAPAPAPARTRPKQQQRKGQPRGKPGHPLLEKLFELYPQLFGAQFKPLKIGAFEDLMTRHPDAFKRDELKVAMGLHARSTPYLECVAAGLQRHDLDGQPVGPVAPEHVHHAIMEVFRRRQQRTKEDLRPRVVARLVSAIEASGIPAQEYATQMRTQDESANALVDEAVSQLAQRAAKREALSRAYQASGLSVEAFAEMYGMDPAEVARTLG
ncbi:MAG: prop effector [Ramlibacter sp.]|jgi:ProP effector|nr:prop effector [Ramlibacter sp.]